jgi:tetratricopeptide (TPR) repeat protein
MRPGDAPLANLTEALSDLAASAGRPADEDQTIRSALRARIAYDLRQSSFGVADALGRIDGLENRSILLVVDQFEELFRFSNAKARGIRNAGDEMRWRNEAAHFVQLLLEAARSPGRDVRVLLTMRSDFIGDCARFHGLPEAVSTTQFLVPSLTRDQIEEVIRKPIEKAGATIAPELVERLLNDCSDELDQLPVLQHCLARLWERAGRAPESAGSGMAGGAGSPPAGRHITDEHYREIGRIGGALSQHADEILEGLTGAELAVERVFRALSELDKEGRAVRRALPFSQLVAETGMPEETLRRVVDRFRADDCSFLVPSLSQRPSLGPETRIDVGHEALLRRWTRLSGDTAVTTAASAAGDAADGADSRRQAGQLREWARDELLSAETYRHLETTAKLWKKGEAALWTEPDLGNALAWREREQPNKYWAARYGDAFDLAVEFLDKSRAEEERRQKAEQQREEDARRREIRAETAERQRRTARVALAAAVLGALFMAAVSYLAWQQSSIAARERIIALEQMDIAAKERVIALQQMDVAVKNKDEAVRNLNVAVRGFDKMVVVIARANYRRDVPAPALIKISEMIEIMKFVLQQLEKPTADIRHLLAEHLHEMSEVRLVLGEPEIALRQAEEEFEVALGLTKEDPESLDWEFDLAKSYQRIGEALQKLGDTKSSDRQRPTGAPESARDAFRGFLDRMLKLAGKNSRQDEWQRSLSKAWERWGDVLQLEEGQAALDAYREKLKIAERNSTRLAANQLAVGDERQAYWKWDIAVSHLNIGDMKLSLGLVDGDDGATAHFEKLRTLASQLVESDPDHARWRWNLASADRRIGEILLKQGNLDGALVEFERYLSRVVRIARQDPTSNNWQRTLAFAHEKLGDLRLARSQPAEAQKDFERARAIAIALYENSHQNTDFKRDLSIIEKKIGDALMFQDNLDGAVERYREHNRIALELVDQDSGNLYWQRDLALSYRQLGEVLRKLNDRAEASKQFEECLKVLRAYGKSITVYDARNTGPVSNVEEDCVRQLDDLKREVAAQPPLRQ